MENMPEFKLVRPRSIAEAVAVRAASPQARYLAGGTDIVANIRRGITRVDALIDLGLVSELRGISVSEAGLRIGAGATLFEVATDPHIRHVYPGIAQAAASIAGPSHRNVGTVGGNLCLDTRCRYYNQSEPWREANAYCMKIEGDACRVAPGSPRCWAAFSGDLAPALMIFGAVAEIACAAGTRRMSLAEAYADDGIAYLALMPGELMVAVHVPAANGLRSAYEKIRVRGAIDFPLAGVAVALKKEGAGFSDLRIAVTGTDSRPVLITGLDAVRGITAEDDALIEKALKKQTGPMESTIAPANYRRRVTPVLAKRLIRRLLETA